MAKKDQYVEKPENSSMTPDFEEMKEHGKVMDHMSTNKELEKQGKTPDPVQHDKEK
ncbi:hypothetical protein WD019_14160 [Fictibacillus sp. Mic-4]|uniref:hypothetical protein n=1 Tax=Fictibacillus TaxID=1329200 RepID=UPI00041E05CF|nr:hypothetical protein [Fictibacillus gelatini]